MADLTTTPVATQIQPPKGMTLADMVNLAGGVQAYQQAQQINPLQLQKAQLELQQAQLLNPIAAKKAGLELSNLEAISPSNIAKAKSEADLAATQAKREAFNLDKTHLDVAGGALTGLESRAKLHAKTNDFSTALKELNATEKMLNAYGLPSKDDGPFAQARQSLINKDMNGYLAQIENMRNMQASASEKFTANMPEVKEINGVKYLQDKTTGQLKPLPLPGTNIPAGNEKPKTTTTSQQTGEVATPLVHIDEFKSPGQFSEQEKDRYNAGAKDWQDANERAQIAADSKLASSQIRRSLAQAAGSKPGQVVREAGKALFGNSELDTLLKNMAQQQLRQSKLMGIDTVNAEKDLKMANGSENITAEALAHIVDQVDATNLAAEKYNKAQEAMQAKHGKDKTYLNNDNFKKAWATNYDPLAFIIQSTNRRNIPQADKEKIVQYYAEKMGAEDQEQLKTKLKNLKRLERGDF